MALEFNAPTSRRDAFKIGGLAVTMGALVAACGEDRGGDDAPGRVGNAPIVTSPPDWEVNDVVLLRTASSLELTAVEVYEQVLGLDGALDAALVPFVNRLIEDHRAVADQMAALTEAAGGEAWTCANPWLMDRLVEPVVASITSNVIGTVIEEDGATLVQVMGQKIDPGASADFGDIGSAVPIDPSADLTVGDDVEFSRLEGAVPADVLTLASALENLASAAHQELTVASNIPEARIAHLEASVLEARHAAAIAIATNGEGGYFSPVLIGEEDVPDARSQFRQYAIPSTFGKTAQIEIKAGPGDINNVRKSFILQTPAANSFAYAEISCDA